MHPDSALADVYISLKSESVRSPSHGATTYTAHDSEATTGTIEYF